MLVLEDLNIGGLKIYQDDELYRFTSDAILLSRFISVKKGDVAADFCAGSGIVSLHLYGLNPIIQSFTLFEKQASLSSLAEKSIAYNRLEEKFKVVNVRVQDISAEYNGKFSLIVCNPPYMEKGSGFSSEREEIALCRTEIDLPLSELVSAVAKALKFGGRINMVHRADRLIDVVSEMKNCGVEPKKLQFVAAKGKAPYLFMIEGVKGGKSGLKVLPEIYN